MPVIRLGDHPFGEYDLLLVAAGKRADVHIDVMTFDVEVLAVLFHLLAFDVIVHHTVPAHLLQRGERGVLTDVLQQV